MSWTRQRLKRGGFGTVKDLKKIFEAPKESEDETSETESVNGRGSRAGSVSGSLKEVDGSNLSANTSYFVSTKKSSHLTRNEDCEKNTSGLHLEKNKTGLQPESDIHTDTPNLPSQLHEATNITSGEIRRNAYLLNETALSATKSKKDETDVDRSWQIPRDPAPSLTVRKSKSGGLMSLNLEQNRSDSSTYSDTNATPASPHTVRLYSETGRSSIKGREQNRNIGNLSQLEADSPKKEKRVSSLGSTRNIAYLTQIGERGSNTSELEWRKYLNKGLNQKGVEYASTPSLPTGTIQAKVKLPRSPIDTRRDRILGTIPSSTTDKLAADQCYEQKKSTTKRSRIPRLVGLDLVSNRSSSVDDDQDLTPPASPRDEDEEYRTPPSSPRDVLFSSGVSASTDSITVQKVPNQYPMERTVNEESSRNAVDSIVEGTNRIVDQHVLDFVASVIPPPQEIRQSASCPQLHFNYSKCILDFGHPSNGDSQESGKQVKVNKFYDIAPPPANIGWNIPAKTRSILEHHRSKVMCSTRSFEAAWRVLTGKSQLVVITGWSGDGKTSIGNQLLAKACTLNHEPTPYIIDSVSEWGACIDLEALNVVFLDDMFGKTEFERTLFESWKPRFKEIESGTSNRKLWLIISIGRSVFDKCKEQLFQTLLFGQEHIIDLSSGIHRLTSDEKVNILEAKLLSASVTVTEDKNGSSVRRDEAGKILFPRGIVRTIAAETPSVWFPKICADFLSSEANILQGQNFFWHPLPFQKEEIEGMFSSDSMVDRNKAIALVTVLIHRGSVDLQKMKKYIGNNIGIQKPV